MRHILAWELDTTKYYSIGAHTELIYIVCGSYKLEGTSDANVEFYHFLDPMAPRFH